MFAPSKHVRRFTSKLRTAWVLLALLLALPARPAAASDAVTDWTLLADRLGQGAANWRTLAVMHQAMHDALNAVLPVHARWALPHLAVALLDDAPRPGGVFEHVQTMSRLTAALPTAPP